MFKIVLSLILIASVSSFDVFEIYLKGQRKNIQKAPYRVSIIHKDKPRCSGALIGIDYVLTLSDCFFNLHDLTEDELRNYEVRIGAPLLYGGGQKVAISKVDYFGQLTILRLEEHVELSESVKIIPISARRAQENDTVFVAGWDETFKSIYFYTDYFAALENTVILEKVCSDSVGFFNLNNILCVNSGDDFCNADPGSPIVINGELIGLTHFYVSTFCKLDMPLFAVSVPAYLDRINYIIDSNS